VAASSTPGDEPVPLDRGDDDQRRDDAPDDASRAAALLRDAEEVAAARGREMVNEARAVRRRMLDDAERRRRTLLDELDRVRGVIDELARELAEVVPAGTDAPPARPDETDPGADDLFAQLREEQAAPPPPAPPPLVSPPERAPPAARPAPAAPPEPAPVPTPEVSEAPRGDDATRGRRDELLAPLSAPVLRAAKRLLQDEHNDLLDAIRRVRGRVDAARLLPDPEKQHSAWSAVIAPSVDEAYTVGRALTARRRRPTAAPRRLVAELAAGLITPLRDRLMAMIDTVSAEGPYESPAELQAALSPAVSARYREWRTEDLEALLADLLAAAYARGAFDAAPSGATLRWVPAEVGQCPDADDNALEPTVKGQCFPTGQPYPPAHPGCRCLVVPSDGEDAQTPG
jgi:hypothetical protein